MENNVFLCNTFSVKNMMKNLKIWLAVIVLFLPFTLIDVFGQDGNTYSTPGRLFYIARSANKNLVCYDVNLVSGKLDVEKPINVYWVNREEHPGKTNGLSYIQRKMAYGYKLISSSDDASVCSLTAYPDRKLTIEKGESGYVCYIQINNKKAILKSLYVKASPRNPLSVEYVELRGVTVDSKEAVTERVKKK